LHFCSRVPRNAALHIVQNNTSRLLLPPPAPSPCKNTVTSGWLGVVEGVNEWVGKDRVRSSYRREASRPLDVIVAVMAVVMMVVVITAAPAATAETVAVTVISRQLRNQRIRRGRVPDGGPATAAVVVHRFRRRRRGSRA